MSCEHKWHGSDIDWCEYYPYIDVNVTLVCDKCGAEATVNHTFCITESDLEIEGDEEE